MELILLKGKKDSGKTTTAKMVYEDLKKEAEEEPIYIELDDDLEDNEKGDDFKAIIKIQNKIVHIISRGDARNYFRDHIFPQYDKNTNVEILILCVRTEEQDARINGPMEDFVINWFNNIIEKKTYFQMNFVKNADDCKGIIEAKKETAQEIVKYIIDEISKQNEN